MPPFFSQSLAGLFHLCLFTTSALLFASLLCPPKGVRQEAIDLFIVDQSELPQDRDFNWTTSQLLHRKEFVNRVQDPNIIFFVHVIVVEEVSVFPGRDFIGDEWSGGSEMEPGILANRSRVTE